MHKPKSINFIYCKSEDITILSSLMSRWDIDKECKYDKPVTIFVKICLILIILIFS